MKPRIDLITILTDDVPKMVMFYREVLGFSAPDEAGPYVEFQHEGVRFAICARSILYDTTQHESFRQPVTGRMLELAFPCDSPADVDSSYEELIKKGATPILPPADMPWGQRAAFFADPDGNIHEIFAALGE